MLRSPHSHTPDLRFKTSCACTRVRPRVSMCHVHRFYQMCYSSSASLVKTRPFIVLLLPPLLVSRKPQKPFPCAFDSRISRRPVSSFLPNYYSETPALSRHWLAVVRKHSLLMMTGAALVGRRWADRQCRDRTVSFSLLSPCLIRMKS